MASEMMIGIDVAKDSLVIDDGVTTTSIVNEEAAIACWLATIPLASLIGLEATGGYHQPLADLAFQAGMVVYLLNPRDVRHYAQGLGRRGKTDRVDAAVIRRFVLKEHDGLRPYQPATQAHREIALLQRRRACVVKHRQALRKSLAGVRGLEASLREALERIDALLSTIDRQIRERLATQPEALAGAKRMETMPGLGEQTATQLAALFDRVPLDNGDAVVAFVGLDPRPLDSGLKHGRRLLYNCAQAAVRTSVWKPYYQRLRAKGFPSTAALVIVGRKLLRIAFALWQQPNAVFDPQKVTCLGEGS